MVEISQNLSSDVLPKLHNFVHLFSVITCVILRRIGFAFKNLVANLVGRALVSVFSDHLDNFRQDCLLRFWWGNDRYSKRKIVFVKRKNCFLKNVSVFIKNASFATKFGAG